MAQPGGSYAFTEVPDGDYDVYAGEDADGDQLIGILERRWGALGGSAMPTGVTVNGAGTYPATFTVGFPIEAEPNNDFTTTNVLPIGGYLSGIIATVADVDVSRVLIPTDGTYTFEASAIDGACGFALGEDTILQLYDSNGVLLLENDDIDFAGLDWCSRITTTLTAGSYFVAVFGYNALSYKVEARTGT